MYSLALLAPGLLLATGEPALVERVARDTWGRRGRWERNLASRREGFAAAVIPSGGPGKDRGATRAFDGRYVGCYEEVVHGRELTHGVSLVPFAYVTLNEKGWTAVESG